MKEFFNSCAGGISAILTVTLLLVLFFNKWEDFNKVTKWGFKILGAIFLFVYIKHYCFAGATVSL